MTLKTTSFGCFGDLNFGAGPDDLTFRSVNVSVSPSLTQAKTLEGSAVFSAVGEPARTISITGMQHIDLHPDPMKAIRALDDRARRGAVEALIVGSEMMGFFVINSLSYGIERISSNGAAESITWTLNLTEARPVESKDAEISETIMFNTGAEDFWQ